MLVENIKKRGLMLVLSAPSGTGKTTLAQRILQEDKEISLSISATTRNKRVNEVDKDHYYFLSQESFKENIVKNRFLEYAKIYNEYYGTLKKEVLRKLNDGKDILFDIDWQGHKQLRKVAGNDVIGIFILPPSKIELFHRLHKRNQDSSKIIHQRLSRVNEEIKFWVQYDYVIINDNIENSVTQLMNILKAERLKQTRRIGLKDFVDSLNVESSIK